MTLAGCFPKRPGASLTISTGTGGKTNSEEEFHEQMHCYGQSKVAVTFDIQFAKLPQLKVICTNSAGSGPGGECELLDKCSASLFYV